VRKRTASVIQSRGRLLLVAICVSVGLGAFAIQALGSLGKARNFAVGTLPTSVAIGDLNGDGKRDLAVTNSGSDNVSVLLAKGAGSFGKARNFAARAAPRSVAIGDLNRDGSPDLAVANTGSNSVSVLLGNGDGSFGVAPNFAVGRYPASVAIGDLNRDGKLDLAVANSGSSQKSVSVLLGNGDGGFGAATNLALGTGPVSVAIGDFNGDRHPDLVASRRTNVVSVLLGNGDGSFGVATNFAVGRYPASVAIGDLNRDGNLDLAVANAGSYKQQPSTVSILLGNGAGNFGVAKNFAAGFTPTSIAIGDLNRDGKLDLAVSNETVGSGFAHVSILIGNGGGTFAAPRHLRVGSGPSQALSVAIGNLNAGSYPDIAVAKGGAVPNHGSNVVSVLLNGGPSPRTLTLSYRRRSHRFTGRLRSWDPACIGSQRVKVLRRRPGRDQKIATATTGKSGTYSVRRNTMGTFYARVASWSACRAESSKVMTLR
jgi:hypothetical protein